MTKDEIKERVNKVSDADYAQQCWDLLFDVENEYWQKIYTFFRNAADGNKELDAPSLERAQGCVRAAIEDLQKLDVALEVQKGDYIMEETCKKAFASRSRQAIEEEKREMRACQ